MALLVEEQIEGIPWHVLAAPKEYRWAKLDLDQRGRIVALDMLLERPLVREIPVQPDGSAEAHGDLPAEIIERRQRS